MNLLDKIGSRVIFAGFMLAKNLLTPVAFGVMGLALDSRGRVLLVRQSYMKGWRLPGGGANRGEPAAEAIMRELREEVGPTSCAAPELLGLYTRRAGWVTVAALDPASAWRAEAGRLGCIHVLEGQALVAVG